jgi:hypothetical protein
MVFQRPEHEKIAAVLKSMDADFLERSKCFFGGGTAIVLKHDEYRKSLDLDFLCADKDGYRELRNAFFEKGIRAIFPADVNLVRDVKADAYGIRMLLEYQEQPIKFEIVREVRVDLGGWRDPDLRVPILSTNDMFTEKLLANADRCMDRAVGYRDALDLGCLVDAHGEVPAEGVSKAEGAYGADIARKMAWVLNRLLDKNELREAATKLQMDSDFALAVISDLRAEGLRIWPDAGIEEDERPASQPGTTPGY